MTPKEKENKLLELLERIASALEAIEKSGRRF